MSETRDWSARHGRIRIAMMLAAFAVFACARLEVSFSGEGLLGLRLPEWTSREMLAFWLTLAFIYIFLHFLVRTRAERPGVGAQSRRLHRAMQRIDDMRKRTGELFRSLGGALLSERLSSWDEAIRRVAILPGKDDMARIGALTAKMNLFEELADKIKDVLDGGRVNDGGHAIAAVAADRRDDVAEQLLLLLDRMDEVSRSFDQRRLALVQALTETREILGDAKRLFSSEDGHGAEDMHAKLDAAMGDLRKVRRELAADHRSFSLDRNLFSVGLPVLVSLAFVLASADTVVRGAAASAHSVAVFVGRSLALVPGL